MSQAAASTPEEPWVPDLPTDTFAQRLRYLRLALDLPMAEMARRVGVPEATWGSWERGSMPRGQGSVVETIHELTKVSRSWLMWGNAVERYTGSAGQGVQAKLFEPGASVDKQAGRHLQAL